MFTELVESGKSSLRKKNQRAHEEKSYPLEAFRLAGFDPVNPARMRLSESIKFELTVFLRYKWRHPYQNLFPVTAEVAGIERRRERLL